jgi:hypothetical protein
VPSGGAEALWLLSTGPASGLFESDPPSGRNPKQPLPQQRIYTPPHPKKAKKKRRFPFLKKHRFLVTNTTHKAGLFHSRKNQNSGVYFTENIKLRGSPKLLLPLS